MFLKVNKCSASQRDDCKDVSSKFLSCTVNFHLGFKNSVFKAKVIFQIFVKSDEISKDCSGHHENPGPLAEIPQMIYLQKESSQSTQWVKFRIKETKNQCYKVSKEKTLESGFVNEIFSNETYKSPNSLLSLSLCILTFAREIERVIERKERKRSNFGQQRGARPVERGARPVGRCATRPELLRRSENQRARPVGRGATRWEACATRWAGLLQTSKNFPNLLPNHQICSR